MLQETLAEQFRAAIELEQKWDTLLTSSYLEAYLPKRLALLGLAVVNLSLSNMRTGFGGKSILDLSLDPAYSRPGDEIQQGSFRVGDIVRVDRMDGAEKAGALEGVISRFTGKSVSVSVEEDSSDESMLSLYNNTGVENNRMWIVKLTNSLTYKRMLQACKKLEVLPDANKSEFIRILLGETKYVPRAGKPEKMTFFDENLNESQKSAIEFAIYKSPVTIIHGPPGTGKTYTLIELIKQLKFNHGERMLVCGASNISVDNILERLSSTFNSEPDVTSSKKVRRKKAVKTKNPEKLIRIGHPARLLEANLQHSLDILSKTSYSGEGGENVEILVDIEKDIGNTLSAVKKCKRYGERKALWGELKQLRRELRDRERKLVHDLLQNAEVILATLHGSGANELVNLYKDLDYSAEKPFFDTIIIDEVSQSLEPQCWIALLNHLGCRRLVIAGDNKQLPATVKSKETAAIAIQKGEKLANLEFTLFDRLVADLDGDEFRKLLNVQYRMNEKIMEFPSKVLYGGELKAAEAVRAGLLSDLPNVTSTDETSVPCIWYDTQGGDYSEQTSDEGPKSNLSVSTGSKYNEMEALVVQQHVQKLVEAGVMPEQIGVISPYSAQISALKRTLAPLYENRIEISTIDGFQGREKEAIVLSLVRSNDNREVGFLNDPRRLNVAMTRPKKHLCVVGDMELLGQCGVKFLSAWAEYADQHYDVRYPDLGDY